MKIVFGAIALLAATSVSAQTINCQTYYWGQTTCTQAPSSSGVNYGLLNSGNPWQQINNMPPPADFGKAYMEGQEMARRNLELKQDRTRYQMCLAGHTEFC